MTRSLLFIVAVVPLITGLTTKTVQAQVGGLPVNPEAGNNNNPTEAPAANMDVVAFDDTVLHNGFTPLGAPIDETTNPPVAGRSFRDNKFIFEEQEFIEDGLGPTYNAQSCAECHQNTTTGGGSQLAEHRAGHLVNGNFVDAPGGSLIHSRAVAASIVEISSSILEDINTLRMSLPLFGDGFIECISNTTLVNIRNAQPAAQRGTLIAVPVVEANGAQRIGRFGWKGQHASLVSFSGDAYVNEMGITNPFQSVQAFQNPANIVENTSLGRSVAAFDLVPEPEDDGEDAEAFADFMRATRVPGRGPINQSVTNGQTQFNNIGCAVCHTPTIVTAPVGTVINGGQFTVPAALGNKIIHPFSDFALHDIGTGDGIVQNGGAGSRNQIRTPALWGLRLRNRFLHDGVTLGVGAAIRRHAGQATAARDAFINLTATQRTDVVNFLLSL